MRVLVCGGRHFNDFKRVWKKLTEVNAETPITCIISGGCSGADQFAKDWADAGSVPSKIFKADWALGPAAGPLRNQQMLDEGKPDFVIAFPGGRGTADMVRRAKAAGVRGIEVRA
jgi:hypothetical protein